MAGPPLIDDIRFLGNGAGEPKQAAPVQPPVFAGPEPKGDVGPQGAAGEAPKAAEAPAGLVPPEQKPGQIVQGPGGAPDFQATALANGNANGPGAAPRNDAKPDDYHWDFNRAPQNNQDQATPQHLGGLQQQAAGVAAELDAAAARGGHAGGQANNLQKEMQELRGNLDAGRVPAEQAGLVQTTLNTVGALLRGGDAPDLARARHELKDLNRDLDRGVQDRGVPNGGAENRGGPARDADNPARAEPARPGEAAPRAADPVAQAPALAAYVNTIQAGGPGIQGATTALANFVAAGGTATPAVVNALGTVAVGNGPAASIAQQALGTVAIAGGPAAQLAQGVLVTVANALVNGQNAPAQGALPNTPGVTGAAVPAATPAAIQSLAAAAKAGGPAGAAAVQTLAGMAQGGAALPPGAVTALGNAVAAGGAAAPMASQALGTLAQAGTPLPPGAVQALTTALGTAAAPAAAQALGAAAQRGVALPPGTVAALSNAVAAGGAAAPVAAQALGTLAQAGTPLPPGAVQVLTAALGTATAPVAAQALGAAAQRGAALPAGTMSALAATVAAGGAAAPAAGQALGVLARSGTPLPAAVMQTLAGALGTAAAPVAAQALGAAMQAGTPAPSATVAALATAVGAGGKAAPAAALALAAAVQGGSSLPPNALPTNTLRTLVAVAEARGPAAPAATQALAALAQAGVALPANTVAALATALRANSPAAPAAAQALAAMAQSGTALPAATLQALAAASSARGPVAPAAAQALASVIRTGAAVPPTVLQALASFVQTVQGPARAAMPAGVQATAAAVLAGKAAAPAAMQALVKAGLEQLALVARQAPAAPDAAPALAQPRSALTMGAPTGASTRYASLDTIRPDSAATVAGRRAAAAPEPAQPGATFAGAFSPSFAARVLGNAAPLMPTPPTPPAAGNPIMQTLVASANSAEAARLDKAVLDATMRLQGPLGRLLTDGVAPGLALAAQQLWEGSVLGGWNPATGSELPPIWVRWRLGSATELDKLVERLTGQTPGIAELSKAADRPSRVGALLLGQPAAALSVAGLDPRRAEPSLMALGAADFTAGLNGLVRLDGPPPHLSGATGITAVGTPDGSPLLLAHLRPQHTAGERIALGAGLSAALGAAAPGIPASATVSWSGALPDAALGAAGGTLGGLAADRAADRAGAVLAQLAAMLLAGVRQGGEAPASVAVQVPLDGGPPGGAMRFASGQEVQLGAGLPGTLAGAAALGTGPAPDMRVNATLGLGGPPVGRSGAYEVLGPHVTYNERRAVPLDIVPAAASVASWRLDDTEVQVAVGDDGAGPALAQAKKLYQRLQAGKLPLDGVPAGCGFSTWDGSPAWLGLGQVAKPAASGVLPGEAEPPRMSLLRAPEGDWLLLREGGKEGRKSRQAYTRDAADDAAFYNDAVFGLPHGADLRPPGGAAGTLAVRGFKHARAAMAEPPGADRLARARAGEAWGMVARLWAGVLDRLSRAGAGRLATRGDAVSQAGALREIASWSGSVAALVSAREARLDLHAVLAAVGADTRASLTRALAPAVALLGTLEQPGDAPDAPSEWPPAARLLVTGHAEDREAWGQEALHLVAAGQPHRLDWDGALVVACALRRLEAPDGVARARRVFADEGRAMGVALGQH